MGLERPKQLRRVHHLWKKALLHFALCFVMGFFTGFAPSSTSSWTQPHRHRHLAADPSAAAASHVAVGQQQLNLNLVPPVSDGGVLEADVDDDEDSPERSPRRLLIVVTTARSGEAARERRQAELLRLAHTLRLVRPPVLWVVVEPAAEAAATAETLRGTGVMYRHLAFRPEENFTSAEAEAHAQRNAALAHVEKHRLSGIVHFADAAGMYDLQFFEEIRQIEVFGTWPVATMSVGKKVVVEGPLCSSSKVVGWFSRDFNDGTTRAVTYNTEADLNPAGAAGTRAHTIDVSGFAFNSSILWDPERWGRPTSLPDTSQDSIKFVQEVVLEDRAKLKGIPSDCSQIMMWQYNMPNAISLQTTSTPHNRR